MPPSTGAVQHAVITVVVTDVASGSDRSWATNLAASVADTVRDRLGDMLGRAMPGPGHDAVPGAPAASGGLVFPDAAAPAVVAAVAAWTPVQPAPTSGVVVDRVARRIFAAGRPLQLTRREFDLLAFLAEHPGSVFSRAELLRLVWGEATVGSRTVDVHVRRLRAKLGSEAHRLVTIRNVGYRIDADDPRCGHPHSHDLEPVA